MFYYASKILSFLVWPSNVVALLIVAGAVMLLTGRVVAWGRRLLATGVGLMLACGYGPIGNLLVVPLEQRFARGPLPSDVAGVIILGGFETASITQSRGHLAINQAGDRLTEGILVALSRPQALVVFTGGEGSLLSSGTGAAGAVGGYLEAVGIARERIVLESRSRTTYENALYLKDMLKPQPGRRWVLVTSAFHMPRSVGTFRRLGFEVLAWPADYRTRGAGDLLNGFLDLAEGLDRTDLGFKEWLGLVAYRLSGRSSELWPGHRPEDEDGSPAPAAAPAAPLPAR